jgi:hypothetical protein
MKQAINPFQFVASSYLIRICPQRVWTLGELSRELSKVSADSIFYHTFQTQESHNYTTFSNDFAQWVETACKVPALSESLAAMDLRDYPTVEDLRHFLVGAVEAYLEQNPQQADEPAYEPFYFCESVDVVVPLETRAWNLAELAAGIRKMSPHTLFHHFINSRLREPLQTNDFSFWIETSLGLPDLAQQLNQIDFYVNTLEGVRNEILRRVEEGNR